MLAANRHEGAPVRGARPRAGPSDFGQSASDWPRPRRRPCCSQVVRRQRRRRSGLARRRAFPCWPVQLSPTRGRPRCSATWAWIPGSAITGAPHALGATHINDGVALSAKNALTVGYTDAAGRPATKLASADLSGQSFTPGVYDASSSLLFSAGNVTLNAQGNPNAVFIFQVGSSLTTGSATKVLLTNGAQPCNVFWQIGASATLGTNSVFAGTVMALTTITANTGATLDGRLLARNGAVNLDTNTITTSACAAGSGGSGGTTGGGTGGSGGTDRKRDPRLRRYDHRHAHRVRPDGNRRIGNRDHRHPGRLQELHPHPAAEGQGGRQGPRTPSCRGSASCPGPAPGAGQATGDRAGRTPACRKTAARSPADSECRTPIA